MRRRRHRIPQFDLPLPGEPFRLIGETGIDPDRLRREQEKRERTDAERRQFEAQNTNHDTDMTTTTTPDLLTAAREALDKLKYIQAQEEGPYPEMPWRTIDNLELALNAQNAGAKPDVHPSGGFRVRWTIDVEAPNPKAAAVEAMAAMQRHNTTATVFEVTDGAGKVHVVDLLES